MKEHCFNHPKIVAECKCAYCRKPLCGECATLIESKNFCNLQCYQDLLHYREKKAQLAKKPKKEDRKHREALKLLKEVFLMALVIYLFYYLFFIEEIRSMDDLHEWIYELLEIF